MSAADLGDLGEMFGVDQSRWAGASGITLLTEVDRHRGDHHGLGFAGRGEGVAAFAVCVLTPVAQDGR